jgi:hypothetical protein
VESVTYYGRYVNTINNILFVVIVVLERTALQPGTNKQSRTTEKQAFIPEAAENRCVIQTADWIPTLEASEPAGTTPCAARRDRQK